MTALTTERYRLTQPPRFFVGGNEDGTLSANLQRLEVWHDIDAVARVEASFLNWDNDPEQADAKPSYVYFDREKLDFGKTLRVRAGEDDNGADIFEGPITALCARYDQKRPPELVVKAESVLGWLRMGQRSRTHATSTADGIASRIAEQHGFRPGPGEADSTEVPQDVQLHTSDLAFLRQRARDADARITFSSGQLELVRRFDAAGEAAPLSTLSELVSLSVDADLAHQRTAVTVHGYDPRTKQGIHETATEDVVLAERSTANGRTGPAILNEISVEALEDVHLDVPATPGEARRMARARMCERSREFLIAHGTTDGTPGLTVGQRIEVVDAGPWFNGAYHVAAVHHSWDRASGLRTSFRAERVDIGGSS